MRTIVLALIALTLSGAIAQSCSNPLGAKLGITLLSSPADPAGAKFCKGQVTAKSSCCTADTINSLQTKIDEFKSQLQNIAGTRDGLIRNTIKNNDLATFQATINSFKDAYLAAVTAATTAGKTGFVTSIGTYGAALVLSATDILTKVQAITSNLGDYQGKRVACYKRALRMQAAALCLACNPNWESKGVNADGTIALSATTCTKLQGDCTAYLIAAASTGTVVAGRKINKQMEKLTNKLKAWSTGVEAWPNTNNLQFSTIAAAAYASTSAADQQVNLPTGCSDASNTANCQWLCTNFFASGKIDIENIGRGGEKVDDSSTGVSASGISRVLATSGSFDYDDADDGMTTDVSSDPSATSSGIKTAFSAIAAVMVSIIYLLI